MIKFLFIFASIVTALHTCGVLGALSTCASASPACSDEPNSMCESANATNCVCVATYMEVSNDCANISCTTVGNECTDVDVNSFCHSTRLTCECKANFVATGVACKRKTCSAHRYCRDLPNTYCVTAGSDTGCTCGFTAPADPTTGACTPRVCTLNNAATACTGGTVCIATTKTYQCTSKANFIAMASSSVQMGCVDFNDCAADSECTNGKCMCSSGFISSGNSCKKQCTGNGMCSAQATCTDGICECNVNYQGNGATCNQLACAGNDDTCNPNSQCTDDLCVCATNYVPDGTICRKSCMEPEARNDCSSNAICINNKCVCKRTYAGDGQICNKTSCVDSSDCSGENTTCSNGYCACETGYKISPTIDQCVPVPTTLSATTADTVSATTAAKTTSRSEKTASSHLTLVFCQMQSLLIVYFFIKK